MLSSAKLMISNEMHKHLFICFIAFIACAPAILAKPKRYSVQRSNFEELTNFKKAFGLAEDYFDDNKVKNTINPNLESCSLSLKRKTNTKKISIFHYDIFCSDIKLFQNELIIQRKGNKIAAIYAKLTDLKPDILDLNFIDPKILMPRIITHQQTKVLYEYKNQLRAAWELYFYDGILNQFITWIVDAENAQIYQKKYHRLSAYTAEVFINNQNENLRVEQPLPDINSSTLDGPYFRVYTSASGENRLEATANEFIAQVDETSAIDQVQSYYAATKVLDWWIQELDYTHERFPIHIYVFASIQGSTNNAYYSPSSIEGVTTIRIGKGDQQKFTYLSRDSDVLRHELKHHLFYPYLDGETDEQVMIHESLADILTYLMTDDPSLAESIRLDGKPLRTALLAPTAKIDDPELNAGPHTLSQYLSASLWALKSDIPNLAKMIYKSTKYLPFTGSTEDFVSALLFADRDLHPDTQDHDFGQNKCLILSKLADRGFARYLDHIKSDDCNLNLSSLAKQSIKQKKFLFLDEATKAEEDSGHSCGTIRGMDTSNHIAIWILLLFPLFYRPRKNIKN